LPIAILIGVFGWIFTFISKRIEPLTNYVILKYDLQEFIASIIAITLILILCFVVGIIVRTNLGKYLYQFIDYNLLSKIPGFKLIRETTTQLIGKNKTLFSAVALVNPFENDTLLTGFITDKNSDADYYTVFIPTGPNPTSGNIMHIKSQFVHIIDISVEQAMKTIISCGAGTDKLMQLYNKELKKTE